MRKTAVHIPILLSLSLLITHQLYPHIHTNTQASSQQEQQILAAQQLPNFLLVNLGPAHLQHFKPYHHSSSKKLAFDNAGSPVWQVIAKNNLLPAVLPSPEVDYQPINRSTPLLQLRGPPVTA